jgi:uncharacterized flavoprotein (TIGR03862 family)
LKTKIAIVGGGASSLMLACELDPTKFEVSIYEKNSALGRKFLVAGDGGLNLTHSEDKTRFIKRYTPSDFLETSFYHFSNIDLINWLNKIGVETFVGSSGRVFPKKGMKPIEVLTHFLDHLKGKHVNLFTEHDFKSFSQNELLFEYKGENKLVKSDVVIFCLGGASWPVTGSTGLWTNSFPQHGIKINPFRASNCSFRIDWPETLLKKIEGKVLKNVAISCSSKRHLGEVVITNFGLEGSGIYPLSPEIRTLLEKHGKAEISVDLKPNLSLEKVNEKLTATSAGKNITERLKNALNINEVQMQLLKHFLSKENYLNTAILSENIKAFKLEITGSGPLEEAISSVGGVDLGEIDTDFQLKKMPNVYAIGEMLDYDAPTGGYLLQSCFSMANYLAEKLNAKTDKL